MLKKKKKVQSLAMIEEDQRLGRFVKHDIYNAKSSRERESMTKNEIANLKKKDITDVVFDSQA